MVGTLKLGQTLKEGGGALAAIACFIALMLVGWVFFSYDLAKHWKDNLRFPTKDLRWQQFNLCLEASLAITFLVVFFHSYFFGGMVGLLMSPFLFWPIAVVVASFYLRKNWQLFMQKD